jgi:pyruvate,orthophosphate dikinase
LFAAYLEKGVFTISPFETIDADGVGGWCRSAPRRAAGPSPA